MQDNRKIIVIVLLLLTVIIGGAAIFISSQIQNNQTPTAASAFGFGTGVNREYFDTFEREFLHTGCYGILSKPLVQSYKPLGALEVDNYEYTITNLEPTTRNPVNCEIKLFEGGQIDLSVFTYSQTSAIDPNAQTLFTRVNSNILKVDFENNYTTSYIFFGKDRQDPAACRLNFFNQRNDFEYISLKITGLLGDCVYHGVLAYELGYVLDKSTAILVDNIIIDVETGN